MDEPSIEDPIVNTGSISSDDDDSSCVLSSDEDNSGNEIRIEDYNNIKELIINYISKKDIGLESIVKQMTRIIFDDKEFLDGMLLKSVLFRCRKYYRKNIYNAHEILKAMDYSGGVLSYEGLELLRNVEMLAFGGVSKNFLHPFLLVDLSNTMLRKLNRLERYIAYF